MEHWIYVGDFTEKDFEHQEHPRRMHAENIQLCTQESGWICQRPKSVYDRMEHLKLLDYDTFSNLHKGSELVKLGMVANLVNISETKKTKWIDERTDEFLYHYNDDNNELTPGVCQSEIEKQKQEEKLGNLSRSNLNEEV